MICASFGSIMMNVLYVIIAIVVLLTMVLIHELGHYIAGRILGFKITEFSIGFGKALWQKRNKRGEMISFRVFPLGGFCAFYGETDDEEDDKAQNLEQDKVIEINNNVLTESQLQEESKNRALKQEENTSAEKYKQEDMFNNKAPWKRIIVFFAGVTANFLSAFIFAIIFLCVGGYDAHLISPSEGYIVNYSYYTAENVLVQGELSENTVVYAINGTEINYARANVFASLVNPDDESITLTIEINGELQDVVILKEHKDADGNLVYGIQYGNARIDYNFGDVLRDFIPFTLSVSVLIVKAFWSIITGAIALNQLGGPISTIAQMTQIASYGIANFLYLLPMLAANLAIFNILPIPGLDGSHVIFTTIEWIRGKPVKRSVENAIHALGIILLFAFVIIIDAVHLITG